MSQNETTPLLENEAAAANSDEAAQQEQTTERTEATTPLVDYLDVQKLSLVSIFCCLVVFAICYFTTLFNPDAGRDISVPEELAVSVLLGIQMCIGTVLVSVLNYARLRRSKLELDWWFNIIVDFLVCLVGFFTSVLYFVQNATSKRIGWCYGSISKDECEARINFLRTIGTLVMIGVMLLAFTHAALLFLRVNQTPTLIQRTRTLRENGWFIGFGRGPLIIKSIAERERTTPESV